MLNLGSGHANMRTRLGANNGSSASLVVPAPFGSRFRAGNGSSSSLAAPGPGFSSRLGAKNGSSVSLVLPAPTARPGTSDGKVKEWGGPPDAHFLRSPASGPPTPKSPLGEMQLPPTPRSETDNSSVFGEEADDMVETIMASVQEKLAKEKETESSKTREMAWLGAEKGRQRAPGGVPAVKASLQSQSPEPVFRGIADQRPGSRGGLRSPPNSAASTTAEPVFRGNIENRPGSRGRIAIHQGPPRYSPPTQELPRPPNHTGHRRGPQGNSHGAFVSRGPAQENRPELVRSEARTNSRDDSQPHHFNTDDNTSQDQGLGVPRSQPSTLASSRINTVVQELRSQSPAAVGPVSRAAGQIELRPRSPARISAVPRGLSAMGSRPQSPASSNAGSIGYRRQDSGSSVQSPAVNEPTLRDLMAQSPEEMMDDASPGADGEYLMEQYARPIIQSVRARRDTLTLNSPRRVSLSMEIEELEKSLAYAQRTQLQNQQLSSQDDSSRASMSSSIYSEDVDEPDEPVVTLQPAPLRSSPLLGSEAETGSFPSREHSPRRGSFILRRGPRRPTLDEYGVPSSQRTANSRPYNPGGGSVSPSSRTNALQFHQPNRTLSPAPTIDAPPLRQRPTVSTVIDAGFKFDFGPNIPPTPDSATWPLASSSSPIPPSEEPELQPEPEFIRQKAPPPLNFNFSPEASSRDPALWTPPLRSIGQKPAANHEHSLPPQGVAGTTLMLPGVGPPGRSRSPVDGLGVGLARGPSMRTDPRHQHVDAFGTGFI